MMTLPTSEYLEVRNGGYYLSGTRIGLDVLVNDFRNGKSPEAILSAYPSIGSLAKVYGAEAFVLEHPEGVNSYLHEQQMLWNELKSDHPLPEDLLERFRRTRDEQTQKSA